MSGSAFDVIYRYVERLAEAQARDTERRVIEFMDKTGLGPDEVMLIEYRGRFHPQWAGVVSGFKYYMEAE